MNNQTATPYKISKLDFFSNQELAELPKLLLPGENVLSVISGVYTSGTAILCVTSKRLLLIDKKLVRLNFEDIRFESISEVNYSHQLFLASLNLYYAGRSLQFKTWYKDALRTLAQFIQDKMFEAREASNKNVNMFGSSDAGGIAVEALVNEDTGKVVENIGTQTVVANETSGFERYLDKRTALWLRARRVAAGVDLSRIGREVVGLSLGK
jgi:hypothetical protein